MNRFLITGVSSGIGRALTKELVKQGNEVFGVARRKSLLESLKRELGNSEKFKYLTVDVSKDEDWKKLVNRLVFEKFIPDIVIFNAAISKRDLFSNLKPKITRQIFETNFFGIIEGLEKLIKIVNTHTQFILISTSSAFKGSEVEGIGYPASKVAASIAFETLSLKYKRSFSFKTIFFGPVNSGMVPFKKFPFMISEKKSVEKIIRSVGENKGVFYCPSFLFFFLKLARLMPSNLYFWVISQIDEFHEKSKK